MFSQARMSLNDKLSRSWAKEFGLELADNLQVNSVASGSFAQVIAPECGGIQVDDIIKTVNGKKVSNLKEFEGVTLRAASKRLQQWSFLIERKISKISGSSSSAKTSRNSINNATRKENRYFVAEVSKNYRKNCNPMELKGCGPLPGSQNSVGGIQGCEYRQSPRLRDRR